MEITEPLVEAKLLKRYKRFFADVETSDQEIVVAHVPNTGSLKGCLPPGAPCIISKSQNPERKLKATLQFVKTPTSWVGVNTNLPNAMVFEAWQKRLIEDWKDYPKAQREVKISPESRIDLVLEGPQGKRFIEVKSVTLADEGVVMFPDAVTTRGQKHLAELTKLVDEGYKAEIIFVVQRQDGQVFRPASHIDPDYTVALQKAHAAGVKIRVLPSAIDPYRGSWLTGQELPFELGD